MEQRNEHQSQSQRGEHGPLPTPSAADARASQPRRALHGKDQPQRSAQEPHRRHSTVGLLAALAFIIAAAWPSLVTAEDGSPTALTLGWAVVLGAIQGATEFLPVSSSGHLSLGQAWLGIDPESAGHRFNITLHAGTLLAVAWVYRKDVGALLRVLIRPGQDTPDRRRLLMMLLASVPLGIVLVPAVENLVIAMEGQVRLVGGALLVTAAILFFAFRSGRGEGEGSEEPPSAKQALLIGIAQVLAVLPGISRSGTTIAVGLAVGLERSRAARFSFLISLIAVGGASAKELLEILTADAGASSIDVVPYAAGFSTSLIVGLLSLRGLLYLVGRGRVGGFVIYLLVMGSIAIAVG